MIGIKDYIKENEGLRLKPYRCTAGKLSIGVGRNLDDVGISEKEANFLLVNDIGNCIESLVDIFGQRFEELSHYRRMVLIDLMFNLGKTRFLGFKKMIQAIKDNDFREAASQMIDSRYARQLPRRSEKNYRFMLGG